MPETLHPGIYIEEIETGPRPIAGVPTDTAAFIGESERGSVRPTPITSYLEYERAFGGAFEQGKFLPHAVKGFFDNGGRRLVVCRVVASTASIAHATFGNFTVRAVGPGAWGERVHVSIEHGTSRRPDGTGASEPGRFRLRVAYYAQTPAQDPAGWFVDPASNPHPAVSEDIDDLVLDANSPDFYETRLRDGSVLVTLERSPSASRDELPEMAIRALRGGSDGVLPLDVADFRGRCDGGARTEVRGLAALEREPRGEVALVYAPAVPLDIARAVVEHCETLLDRFAIVDCRDTGDVSLVDPRRDVSATPFAAAYFPWIEVSDPQTGARQFGPPGGHVAGIYARTDATRGVFRAPAGEAVRGAIGLRIAIDSRSQDLLTRRGCNSIRHDPGRGIVLRGARTLSADPLWKYVNMRRLFTFLERSIEEGTQWVVFEPNDEPLWAHVKDAIRNFLRDQWRMGALMGTTEDEAFFVSCDRTTMTQSDIDNGHLICQIGVAPLRPAEFVIFRLSQRTMER